MIVAAALASFLASGPFIHYPQHVSGQYVVKFTTCDSQADVNQKAAVIRNLYGGTLGTTLGPPACSALFSNWSPGVAATVAGRTEVRFVEENAIFQKATTAYYPPGNSNVNLDRVDQRDAALDWRFRFPMDGQGVKVFVVDSGVALVNNFGSRVLPGYSAVGGSAQVDTDGHGTAMASLAASSVFGIARQATIVPVKVYSSSLSINLMNIITGLQWITTQSDTFGVVNFSLYTLTGGPDAGSIEAFVTTLKQKGLVFVAAAGNANADASLYVAARSADAVAVGGMNVSTNSRWVNGTDGSNYGAPIDIFAPGASANHDTPGNGTQLDDGTSCSAAYTSGALLGLLQTDTTEGPSVAQSRLVAAATQGSMISGTLNGSVNSLLFSDIRAQPLPPVEIAAGQQVFCTYGTAHWAPYNKSIQAVTTDSYNNKYYTVLLAWPSLCHSSNPLDIPVLTVVEKRDSSNALLWSTAVSSGQALTDALPSILIGPLGDVFVAGTTGSCGGGSCPGGMDAVAARISVANGALVWRQTFGSTSTDLGVAVLWDFIDNVKFYVVGQTNGVYVPPGNGGADIFVASLDVASGAVTPRGQFGTTGDDTVGAAVLRLNAGYVVVGSTNGAIAGHTNQGGYDVFLGTLFTNPVSFSFEQQIGTAANDYATAVVDTTEVGSTTETIFVAGRSAGAFGGSNLGGYDVWVGRYDQALSLAPVWLVQYGTALDEYSPGIALSADDVFVATGYELLKLGRPTGTLNWRQSLTRIGQVVATHNTNVVSTYDSGGMTQAFQTPFRAY